MRPEEVFPFLIGALVFMIPIIGILTHHQRKMALIMRGQDEDGKPLVNHQAARLSHEIAELRQIVAQQAIALDNIAESQRRLAESLIGPNEIRERIAPTRAPLG